MDAVATSFRTEADAGLAAWLEMAEAVAASPISASSTFPPPFSDSTACRLTTELTASLEVVRALRGARVVGGELWDAAGEVPSSDCLAVVGLAASMYSMPPLCMPPFSDTL